MVLIAGVFAVAVGGCFAQDKLPEPGSASAHLSQGMAFFKAGETQNALHEFEAANRLDPRSSHTLTWIGITQNQLGSFREAASAFRAALKIDATSQAAHYNLAFSLSRLGNKTDAVHELEEVVRRAPSFAGAQYNLGVLMEEQGQYEKSIPHLEAARKERPDDSAIALHLVDDYFRVGNKTAAIRLAHELFHLHAKGETSVRVGSLLVENGHFQEAIPVLEVQVEANRKSVENATLLARAYIGSNASSKAIGLLEPIKDSDSTGEAVYLLGLAYLAAKQPAQALEAFRTATERRPSDAPAHFHLGALLLRTTEETGQSTGVQELQKAIEVAPREGRYYAALGRWLLENNQAVEALPVLQRGTENAPASAELYLLLSVAQASTQSTQLAQSMAEKAIALDPKIALAHDVLGFCYFRVGDYIHAAGSYKTASDLDPQRGRFAYDAALALERANKAAAAIPYAEKAARLDPSVSINHYLLGKLYDKLGRKPDAIRESEAAIKLDPKLDYPYYLLARMYMRSGDMAKAQECNLKLQELKKQQMKLHGMGGMGVPMPEVQKGSPAFFLGGEQMDPENSKPPPRER
jgi:superkiller protein 3